MIDDRNVIGIILARGGSKRLPGKNIRDFHGKPLIGWTIDAALQSRFIDRVVLSSDDPLIMDVAKAFNCEVPFRRPQYLATDEASSVDAIMHLLDALNIHEGLFVLLQPTSPLRTAQDIDGCINYCVETKSCVCASVTELEYPASWLVSKGASGKIYNLGVSETKNVYRPNGSVYVADVEWFWEHKALWVEGETLGYDIPAERAIDIDTLIDFKIAEVFMKA